MQPARSFVPANTPTREGSFGVIFEGTNLLNNTQVAIKFEPRKSDAPQLRDEYRTYKILVGCRKSTQPIT